MLTARHRNDRYLTPPRRCCRSSVLVYLCTVRPGPHKSSSVDSNLTYALLRCLRSAENFSTPEYSDMARDAIEQIDLTLRLIASYPKVFELIKEPDDVKRVYSEGKIACSICIEG